MAITAVDNTLTTPASVLVTQAARTGTGLSPDAIRASLAMGRKLDHADPGVVRQAAANMVSELFFKPVLAEMRKFPFGRELATGGYTESVFGEQLDQRVADIVADSNTGLARQITEQLQPATPTPTADHATWQTELQVTTSTPQRGDS